MAESSHIQWTDHTKWCTACKAEHPRTAFGKDRSRSDGLAACCLASRRTGRPRGWSGQPRINPATGRPGPAPNAPRPGDQEQARQRVNVEVRTGRRPNPNDLFCALCGHKGDDRRHEYHHHMGYGALHHYDVLPVCSSCHAEAHRG